MFYQWFLHLEINPNVNNATQYIYSIDTYQYNQNLKNQIKF